MIGMSESAAHGATRQLISPYEYIAGHPLRQLFLIFLFSLPLVNPYVHGDGVGYYAYARAPLVQHDLKFEADWRHGNEVFAENHLQSNGQLLPNQYTETGHVGNIFTVGPAILWGPFLAFAHAAVLTIDHFGGAIAADGFSLPYRLAMALGTAFYGFLSLFLSFLVARKYTDEHWAFLATLGIWTASSLPVYMYFNPSWSHAHSAFVVALFFWYWDRTRPERTTQQWIIMGLIAGLMLDTYFPNGIFLLIPLIETIRRYFRLLGHGAGVTAFGEFGKNALFIFAIIIAVIPTLLTRLIVFGGLFRFGVYGVLPWNWSAPNWKSVLVSSDHGLLTWTPILALAILGLALAERRAREIAAYAGVAVLSFYYLIASYPYWDGMSSFGNRFFVSLTPMFVLGLALFLQRLGRLPFLARRRDVLALCLIAGFAVWNAGFVIQWGTQMIPARGPISWGEMIHNQGMKVPQQIGGELQSYFLGRKAMMQHIEEQDIKKLQSQPEQGVR